jgi:hypothetical protein
MGIALGAPVRRGERKAAKPAHKSGPKTEMKPHKPMQKVALMLESILSDA